MNNIEVITNVLLIDSFNIQTATKSNIKSRRGFRSTPFARACTCTKARVKPAAHGGACSHAILLARQLGDNGLMSENATRVRTTIYEAKFDGVFAA